nr:MAG TPA: hypothetical protein [Caudoviricetes sp.]
MPAYCYTVLCPVQGLRDKPEDKSRGGGASGQGDFKPVYRCL